MSQNQNRPIYNTTSFSNFTSSYSAFSPSVSQFPSPYQSGILPLPPIRSDNSSPITSDPDISFVNSNVASLSIQRFLAIILSLHGFASAESVTMRYLELEVTSFIEQLFGFAKDYAELSSRSRPTAEDLMSACEEYAYDFTTLQKHLRKYGKEIKGNKQTTLVPRPHTPPPPELLPSDDEGAPLVIPQTLRSLPSHLPTLPPKHTYLRTPIPPPKKQALPSLEKKLENAALVQDSLRNLLLSTEDNAGQEDGELFGGVVNWEVTKHPRKKWKYRG